MTEINLETIQKIHDSEINFELSVFYDGCFDIRLGDGFNGFVWEGQGTNLQDAFERLIKEILKIYSESDFSKWWKMRNESSECHYCKSKKILDDFKYSKNGNVYCSHFCYQKERGEHE